MEYCPICLDELNVRKRKICTTECNHKFHVLCFKQLKTKTCPCCRAILPENINSIICNLMCDIKQMNTYIEYGKITASDYKSKAKIMIDLHKEKLNELLKNNIQWVREEINSIQEKIEYAIIELSIMEEEWEKTYKLYVEVLLEKKDLLREAILKKEVQDEIYTF